MNDAYLVWKNLSRRRLRLVLTLFAIVVAFLIYGVLGSFNAAFNSVGGGPAANRLLTVNKINFTQSMPLAYVNKLRSVEGVTVASYAEWLGAYYQDPRNVFVAFGVDPETYLQVYDELQLPPDQRRAFLANRQGAIVGEQLARNQGWQVGDRVPIQSNIYTRADDGSHVWDMVIEGIYRSEDGNDSNNMLFHYEYLDESRAFNRDNVGLIVFRTESAQINDRVAEAVDALFANSPAETQTDTEQAFNRAFIAQLGNLALIIGSVVLAAFFTILLIVGNTMMLAIQERTTEIAVMKTLGFTAPRVFRLVLGESLLLALLGGGLGLLAAAGVIAAIRDPIAALVPNLGLDPSVQLTALGLMLLLGVVTGLPPALRAMRLNTITALSRR
jgi:putative ABC transport system permease protein